MRNDLRAFPVLFVDDDAPLHHAVRYVLEDRFTLLTASSGSEALDILAREDIAVLLADQRIPGMTGAALCARARALRPELVTMIVTAYLDIQAATEAINLGQVSAYIPKPWTEGQLVEAVETAISRVRSSRSARELGLEMLRAAPAHVLPIAREQMRQDLLTQVILCRENAQGAIALLEEADPSLSHADRHEQSLARWRAHVDALDRLVAMATAQGQGDDPPALPSAPPSPTCDVADVVHGVVSATRPEVERVARLEVSLEATPVARIARADLGRVVMELLQAAAHAARDQPRATITIQVTSEETHAIVRVTNNLPRAEDGDQRRNAPGLSVATELASRAGGMLSFHNNADGGPVAEVRMPHSASTAPPGILVWGPFVVDLICDKVCVNGCEIAGLQALQVRLLACLIRRAGSVCSHRELRDALFGPGTEGGDDLAHVVSLLRARCGPAGALIRTVRGQGYGICPLQTA